MVKTNKDTLVAIKKGLETLKASKEPRPYFHFIERPPHYVWCRICQIKLAFRHRFLPLNLLRHNYSERH